VDLAALKLAADLFYQNLRGRVFLAEKLTKETGMLPAAELHFTIGIFGREISPALMLASNP
jgi:hypothetical protein